MTTAVFLALVLYWFKFRFFREQISIPLGLHPFLETQQMIDGNFD